MHYTITWMCDKTMHGILGVGLLGLFSSEIVSFGGLPLKRGAN